MKKNWYSFILILAMMAVMIPAFTVKADAATAPTKMWVESTETNGIPAQIDVFVSNTSTSTSGYGSNRVTTTTYTSGLYLPGNVETADLAFSWDGDMQATSGSTTYESGSCAVPGSGDTLSYTFKNGNSVYVFKVTTYKGSANVHRVFIDIDESDGIHTIAAMDGDTNHNAECSGRINIDGTWQTMTKIKGRGNATWTGAEDKKPYNVTLGKKINFPGITSEKTKKWSFLAEITDHSLLCNRTGYHLASEMGIGQDTTSADVWMNGEYQGCYTITPKTDSFVSDDGFMIEQDNYKEDTVANGGDPQFKLDNMVEATNWGASGYNRITVKKMGDNLLLKDGVVDESPENLEDVATNKIQPWLQDAWDAIRSDTGYNSKGKYYTDYIDIESFAKMYLVHEYIKSFDVCAGSILFHRDGMTDTDKLIAGPAWDHDNALGATCQNSSLGTADSRRTGQGDRRSGEGHFIQNVTEYKTSIYKTLRKHQDFLDEVKFQYNKNRAAFDNLEGYTGQMIADITDSAKMNHIKVNDISGTYKNVHKYSSNTTLGSGIYSQSYLATTNSKTDWANYAANLKTYVHTRTLWFSKQENGYYDPNYVAPEDCTHQYETVERVEPTCLADGYVKYKCPICRDTYEEPLHAEGHNYENGTCSVCGETLRTATIVCSEGVSVTVYDTQDLNGPCKENAATANPRDSETGMIDCSGAGQINFTVNLQPGYELVEGGVTAEPAASYKNLKNPAIADVANSYRLTKVSGDLTITVTAQCTHVYESVVTEPTCTERGYTTHTCSNCGDSYVDNYVDALGHDWNEASYTWTADNSSVTAERTCQRDGCGKKETETARTTSEVTKAASCEGKGETTYTSAAFANTAFEVQNKTVANIDALGHDWTAAGYTWADDNSSVTAGRSCKRDGCDKEETETAEATSEVTKEATCEGKGETTYTSATFTNTAFAVQSKTEADINPLGHDWGVPTYTWAEDNHQVTAKRLCQREGCGKDEHETVGVTSEVNKEATCEGKGETTYTSVAFANAAFAVQSKTEEDIDALGHDWEFKGFTWTGNDEDGYTAATADYTCKKDNSHKQTVDATITNESTAETCTVEGTVTYTAAVSASGSLDKKAHSDSKTVTGVAPGHDWCAPTYTWADDNSSVTAKRICQRDGCGESETETANTTSEIAKKATCEDKGETTYTAKFENEAFAEQTKTLENINALGHDYQEVTDGEGAANPATCTEDGKEADQKCTRCGSVKAGAVIQATGHKWDEGTVTKDATCTEKGVKTFTCQNDPSHTKTEDVAALGHDFEIEVEGTAKAPTCTEDGKEADLKCTRCDEVQTGKVIETQGHIWNEDYTVDVEPTETSTGTKSVHCSVCDEIKPDSEVIIDKLEPSKPDRQQGKDGTAVGPGASAEVAEEAIISADTDEGPVGTKYALLKLKTKKLTTKSVTIKWTKVKNAESYVIYGNKCGKKNKMKRLVKITNENKISKVFKKVAGKKVKKGTYYKFIVVALDKDDLVVSTSKVIHAVTPGGKYGNHKSVKVKKSILSKAKKMKVGKSLKLKATPVKASKKRVQRHRTITYESSNPKVAKVTKKSGIVRAKTKGTCYVYAYAQNGVAKKIKVVVK